MGKQKKKWSLVDKGGGKSKRKEKRREGEKRTGEREREKNKKGFHFSLRFMETEP